MPLILPAAEDQAGLPSYDAMRAAVALCASIDEAKDIHDRAAALAAYARQRDDNQLLVWVQEIRLRASVRVGELVRDLDCGQPGPAPTELRHNGVNHLKRDAIAAAGLARHTAYRLQQLAGPRDANLQAAGRAGAEIYFAQARETQIAPTQEGLQAAVTAAVHAAIGPEELARRAKALSEARQAEKAHRRHGREVDLAERTRAAWDELGKTLYPVVYADFPWRQEVWSRENGLDRAADNHYPTMSDDDVRAFPLPAYATCALFMWATIPKLKVAMSAMEGWGFEYKSNWCWNKPVIGTGYWGREKHELLLIGTRGDIPAPAAGDQPPSSMDAPRGRHSEKPDIFAEAIARIFPVAPKLELFARGPRAGWDVWGNEADGEAA